KENGRGVSARAKPASADASASRRATVAWIGVRCAEGHSANSATANAAMLTAEPSASLLIAQRVRRRRAGHAPRGIETGEQRRQQRQRDTLQQNRRRRIDRHR